MSKQKKKSKILVVDDDLLFLNTLKIYLKFQGYDVFVRENGRSALEFCNKLIPDLIILDVKLPDMKGHNVLKELKAQARTRQIPVIFLTVSKDKKSEKLGIEMGAQYYINKPVDMDKLHFMVKNILLTREESLLSHAFSSLPTQHYINKRTAELLNRSNWTYLNLCIDFVQNHDFLMSLEEKGDLLNYFASILNRAVVSFGTADDFIGHGDDDSFVMIVNGNDVYEMVANIRKWFDIEVRGLFNLTQNGTVVGSNMLNNEAKIYLFMGIISDEYIKFNSTEEIKTSALQARMYDRYRQKSQYINHISEFEKWLSGYFSWSLIGFKIKWPKGAKKTLTLNRFLVDKLIAIFERFLDSHGSHNDKLFTHQPNEFILVTQNPKLFSWTREIHSEFTNFIHNQWGHRYGNPALLSLPVLEVSYTKNFQRDIGKDMQLVRGYLFGDSFLKKKQNIHEILFWDKHHDINVPDWKKIRQRIEHYFDMDELELMCFEMGIESQEILGGKKSTKVKGLVEHCFRHGRAFDLIVQCQSLRPHVSWLN